MIAKRKLCEEKQKKKHSSDNTSCKTHTLYTQKSMEIAIFGDIGHEYVLYLRKRTHDFRKQGLKMCGRCERKKS